MSEPKLPLVMRRPFFPFLPITFGLVSLGVFLLLMARPSHRRMNPGTTFEWSEIGLMIVAVIVLGALCQWWVARRTRYTLHEDHVEIATWFLDPAQAQIQRLEYSAMQRVEVSRNPFQWLSGRASLSLVTPATARKLIKKDRYVFAGYETRLTNFEYRRDQAPMKLVDLADWREVRDFLEARIPVPAQPPFRRPLGKTGPFGRRAV